MKNRFDIVLGIPKPKTLAPKKVEPPLKTSQVHPVCSEQAVGLSLNFPPYVESYRVMYKGYEALGAADTASTFRIKNIYYVNGFQILDLNRPHYLSVGQIVKIESDKVAPVRARVVSAEEADLPPLIPDMEPDCRVIVYMYNDCNHPQVLRVVMEGRLDEADAAVTSEVRANQVRRAWDGYNSIWFLTECRIETEITIVVGCGPYRHELIYDVKLNYTNNSITIASEDMRPYLRRQ